MTQSGQAPAKTNGAAVSTWETERGSVTVNPHVIRQMFDVPHATDIEIFVFVKLCAAQKLNPFLGEAYLIKYDRGSPASIVVGKETFTQRAAAHPNYDGHEAGIIVLRNGEAIELPGTFKLETDLLVGAWCKVYRRDRTRPIHKTVQLAEYDTKRSLWKSKKATMIEKVSIVQALRETFPSDFVGLYDSSELGKDIPLAQRGREIEARSRIVDNDKPDEEKPPAQPDPPETDENPENAEAIQPEQQDDSTHTSSTDVDGAVPEDDRHWASQMYEWLVSHGFEIDDLEEATGVSSNPESLEEFMRQQGMKDWHDLVGWFQNQIAIDEEIIEPLENLVPEPEQPTQVEQIGDPDTGELIPRETQHG